MLGDLGVGLGKVGFALVFFASRFVFTSVFSLERNEVLLIDKNYVVVRNLPCAYSMQFLRHRQQHSALEPSKRSVRQAAKFWTSF